MTALAPCLLLTLLVLQACKFDPRGLSTTDAARPRQDTLVFPDLVRTGDSRVDAPPDLLQPPDHSVFDTLPTPDADPCAGMSCGALICCVKNGVPGCHATIEGCACRPDGYPCTVSVAYKVCCDKGGGFQCTNSTEGCKCDYAAWGATCAAPFAVCCDKGSGATCGSMADGCFCVPQTDFPCTATSFPICCNKGGTGFVCTSNSGACLCDPVTQDPCVPPNKCCNTGGGPMCQTGCP